MRKRKMLLGVAMVAAMLSGCSDKKNSNSTENTTVQENVQTEAQSEDKDENTSEAVDASEENTEQSDVFYESYLNDVSWGEEKDITGLTIYQSDCTLPLDLEKLELFSPYNLNDQLGKYAGYSKEDVQDMDRKMDSFIDYLNKTADMTDYSYYYTIDSANNSSISGPSVIINMYAEDMQGLKDAFDAGNWHVTAYTTNDNVDRTLVDIPEDTPDNQLAQAIVDKYGKPTYITTSSQGFSDFSSTKKLTLSEYCTSVEYDFVYEREDYVVKIEIKEGNRDKHYSKLNQVIFYTKTEWEAEKLYLENNKMNTVEIPME